MFKKNSITILLIFAIITFFSCMPSDFDYIIELNPENGKDAFVEYYPLYDYEYRNFGELDEFAAIAWTASGIEFIVRSFVEFDISYITENSKIEEARLLLFAGDSPGHGSGHSSLSGPNTGLLKRVITPWEESTITWNNQPVTTNQNMVIIPESTTQMQDYGINVTKLVQDMVDNPTSSYGFMLRLETEEHYRSIIFSSSECEIASKRPKLLIALEDNDN